MKAIYFDGTRAALNSGYPECRRTKGEATVSVTLAGICGTDIEMLNGYMKYKGVPGHEFVGVVTDADDPHMVGTRVAGEINCGCGTCSMCRRGLQRYCPSRTVLGILGRDGAFAQALTLPKENLYRIPDVISDEEAVFTEPLAAAFEILDQVQVSPDWRVAIVGDGRLAQLVCQVIKTARPAHITCFGRHAQKVCKLRPLGIHTAISIKESDMHAFDTVIEASGSRSGLADAMRLVAPRGTLVLKSTLSAGIRDDLTPAIINEITLVGSRCGRFRPAIDALAAGSVSVKHMADRVFSLEDFDAAVLRAQEPDALKVYLRPAPPSR